MITKVISPTGICKRLGTHPQLLRGLAEAGIIDAYIADNDRITFPLQALDQYREYMHKKQTRAAHATA
jgi:hypothetical protein